jgi:predicted dehydrogenase
MVNLRAAVIGLGPHGRRVVGALRQLEAVELVAVVDRRQEALQDEAVPSSAARYSSVDELWQQRNIDLACIVTNGPSHKMLACQAMEAGVRRLYVEKPLGCSIAECEQIVDTARATGSRVSVGHGRRLSPIYTWLRGRIASGDWGDLRLLWMQRPNIGLGCNAVHSFDAMRLLANRDVRRVTAWVDPFLGPNPRGNEFVDPGGLIVLEMDAGVRAVVAQIEDGAGPTSVELDLTAARVRLDERSGAIEVIERDLSVKPGPNRPPSFQQAELPAGLTAKVDMGSMILQSLVELIGEGPLQTDAIHGLASIEILVAAHLSHRRGNVPVNLPLLSPDDRNEWLPIT